MHSKWTADPAIYLGVGDVVLLADQPRRQQSDWPLVIVMALRWGRQNKF